LSGSLRCICSSFLQRARLVLPQRGGPLESQDNFSSRTWECPSGLGSRRRAASLRPLGILLVLVGIFVRCGRSCHTHSFVSVYDALFTFAVVARISLGGSASSPVEEPGPPDSTSRSGWSPRFWVGALVRLPPHFLLGFG